MRVSLENMLTTIAATVATAAAKAIVRLPDETRYTRITSGSSRYVFFQKRHHGRQLAAGHTLQPGFLRLEMHADENAGKIQHRREDRPDDDV